MVGTQQTAERIMRVSYLGPISTPTKIKAVLHAKNLNAVVMSGQNMHCKQGKSRVLLKDKFDYIVHTKIITFSVRKKLYFLKLKSKF
jgi:hypothetical protein